MRIGVENISGEHGVAFLLSNTFFVENLILLEIQTIIKSRSLMTR